MKPISVIVPTYNSPDALDLCLRSLIEGQRNKNEIIVVVDGKIEVNRPILEKYINDICILVNEENQGLCRSTNLGVYNATNEMILIINDDNVAPRFWDDNLIEEWELLCRQFDHSNIVLTPNQIEPYQSMFPQFNIEDLGRDPKTFDLESFWQYDYHVQSGDKRDESGSTLPIMMNRINYLRVGGWDEHYENGLVADWDFFLKCRLSGMKMVRTWISHFYHFVSLSTAKTPEQIEARAQAEHECHEYAKYKWGSYIKHNHLDNSKFI